MHYKVEDILTIIATPTVANATYVGPLFSLTIAVDCACDGDNHCFYTWLISKATSVLLIYIGMFYYHHSDYGP